jgi:DNA-binding NtrC family response regulator
MNIPPSPPRKILLIDDDELVRLALCEILENAGFQVRTARSGQEGLAAFDVDTPHVVITDIVMPDCDGLEVIMSIREQAPATRIIAISGGGNTLPMKDCIEFARNLGVARAVQKPIRPEQLVQLVQEVLDG